MGERRTSARQRSFLRGRILLNNRQVVLDCLVRDLSEHGAKLIFPNSPAIPDVVELDIPQKDRMLRAHVQWRDGNDVGVTFAPVETAQPAETAELAARVAQLETQVAAMRRMLRRLKADIAAGNEPDAA
jgi:PilZ domain